MKYILQILKSHTPRSVKLGMSSGFDIRVHVTQTLLTYERKTNTAHQIDVCLLHKFPLELGGYYNTGVHLKNVF